MSQIKAKNDIQKFCCISTLSSMKCDEIARAVKSDKLILMVGSSLLAIGNASKVSYISQRMRSLGRPLLELRIVILMIRQPGAFM